MRAVLDLGAIQATITSGHPLVRLLVDLVRAGGSELDMRVAYASADRPSMLAAQMLLGAAVPRMAMSGYVLPLESQDESGAFHAIHEEMRRRHLEALMADVVLVPSGSGLGIARSGRSDPNQTIDAYEDAAALLAAMREAVTGHLELPAAEAALPVLAAAMARTAHAEATTVVDAFIRSARVGQEIGPPRLLVDVTSTHRRDVGTGIQRVVRRITEELHAAPAGRRHAETVDVVFRNGKLRVIESIGGAEGPPLAHRTGETLLMLDALWEDYPHVCGILTDVRRYGGRIVTAVYDIVPLLHPDVTVGTLPRTFGVWFHHAVLHSDGLVCISRAVADEVTAYIRDNGLPHRDGLRIGWWHLGSDIPAETDGRAAPEVVDFLSEGGSTFLMVGTVEPRKRHAVALSAMETLWARGLDARLLVLGREGWNVGDLVRRLHSHPEIGRRLLWRPVASDADIAHAYEHAAALLFPSLTEGYGLPISEAARAGLGAIASDIPVLREVGGDGAAYVAVDDPAALAAAIDAVVDGTITLDPSTAQTMSWARSAAHLREVLDDDRWHVVLRGAS